MLRTGILKTWHDDRGFGFIVPSDGGRELFVHISAFPRAGLRPTVGESLSFEVGPGKDGKQQAIRIQRRTSQKPSHYSGSRTDKSESKRSRSVTIVAALVVVVLSVFGYYKYQQATSQTPEPQTAPSAADTSREPLTAPTVANTTRKRQSAPPKVDTRPEPEDQAPAVADPMPEAQGSVQYRCDGRKHCSEMTSCAEARFFLANCPGTKMDGDHDGVPCEQQWCTGPFEK
jgi:cold shock CspA family protein